MIFTSCGSSEGDFNKLVEKLAAGGGTDLETIHEKLLGAFSISEHGSSEIFFTKNLVLLSGGEEPEVIYPQKATLDADESIDDNTSYGCMNSSNILLGNNKGFCVFNIDGDPVAIFKAEAKETIDAVGLRGGSVIYLLKGKLYEFSISNKSSKVYDKGDFFGPYKKLSRGFVYSTEKYGAVITGIAGSYYISVYDMEKPGIVVKNVEASAFDCAVKGNNLYFLKGGAGNWTVMKYDLVNKSRKEIRKVSKLENVFITGSGFIVYSEGKGRIENYSGEKDTIPREWTIKGSCYDLVLVEYNGKTWLIDFNTLLQKLRQVSGAVKKP